MAFRRPIRRTRRGRRGGRNRPRWSADLISLNVAAGSTGSQVVLSEADFGTSTGLESECVLHRIILSGTASITAVGTSLIGWGIGKMDESILPNLGIRYDPLLVDSLIDDDWLRIGSDSLIWNVAGALPDAGTRDINEDMRVKRKVDSNEVLRFMLSNAAGGQEVQVRITIRILIVVKL